MSEWASYSLSDFLMFSPQTYWRLVARHNASWWPAQVLGVAGPGMLWLLLRVPRAEATRAALLLLALAWAWVGGAFHWQRYSEVFLAAPGLAAACAGQAALLVAAAAMPLRDEARGAGTAALPLLAAALLYPLLAPATGHAWQEAEVFAFMPDPTALATLGALAGLAGLSWWNRAVLAVLPVASLLLGIATRSLVGQEDSVADAVAVAAKAQHGVSRADLFEHHARCDLGALRQHLAADHEHALRGVLGVHAPGDRELGKILLHFRREFGQRVHAIGRGCGRGGTRCRDRHGRLLLRRHQWRGRSRRRSRDHAGDRAFRRGQRRRRGRHDRRRRKRRCDGDGDGTHRPGLRHRRAALLPDQACADDAGREHRRGPQPRRRAGRCLRPSAGGGPGMDATRRIAFALRVGLAQCIEDVRHALLLQGCSRRRGSSTPVTRLSCM